MNHPIRRIHFVIFNTVYVVATMIAFFVLSGASHVEAKQSGRNFINFDGIEVQHDEDGMPIREYRWSKQDGILRFVSQPYFNGGFNVVSFTATTIIDNHSVGIEVDQRRMAQFVVQPQLFRTYQSLIHTELQPINIWNSVHLKNSSAVSVEGRDISLAVSEATFTPLTDMKYSISMVVAYLVLVVLIGTFVYLRFSTNVLIGVYGAFAVLLLPVLSAITMLLPILPLPPNYQLLLQTFIVSFVATAGVVLIVLRIIPSFQHVFSRFAHFLQQRAFPLTSGQERNKFAVLRIIFGLIIFMRAVNVSSLLLPEEYFTIIGIVNGIELFLALFIVIGFCTQFALGFFMFWMWIVGEQILRTSTLANDVGAMVAVFFILTESGRTLSVDSWLIRRFPVLRPLLWYGKNIPGDTPVTIAKFLLAFSYWLMCVYSFSMHLNEPAWMTGVAGPLLFVSNFMSRFHAFFEPILLESNFAVLLARISLFFMMVWYVMLIPWVLIGGWWRKFIIIWGILFFILSGFILQLSSLAYIEALMWIILFWPKWGVDDTKKLLLFYDDKCNLCDRTVQFVRTVDIFDRVVLTPVSRNHDSLTQYGISVDAALEDLHGVIPQQGTVYAGYALYEALARHLLLLWIVMPILWMGRITTIGPKLYRYIANRRRAMFGVCTLPRPKPEWHTGPRPSNELSPLFQIISWHLILLGVIYAISMPAPYIGIKGNNSHMTLSSRFYGIDTINVFNKTDLMMVDNWFTLSDAQTDVLLPIFDTDGSRLAYHRSDRIYFGNTVRFRRGEIGSDDCAFTRREDSMRYLANVWMMDNNITGTRVIRYTQYYQRHPDQKLLAQNVYQVHPTTIRCTVDFSVTR